MSFIKLGNGLQPKLLIIIFSLLFSFKYKIQYLTVLKTLGMGCLIILYLILQMRKQGGMMVRYVPFFFFWILRPIYAKALCSIIYCICLFHGFNVLVCPLGLSLLFGSWLVVFFSKSQWRISTQLNILFLAFPTIYVEYTSVCIGAAHHNYKGK